MIDHLPINKVTEIEEKKRSPLRTASFCLSDSRAAIPLYRRRRYQFRVKQTWSKTGDSWKVTGVEASEFVELPIVSAPNAPSNDFDPGKVPVEK